MPTGLETLTHAQPPGMCSLPYILLIILENKLVMRSRAVVGFLVVLYTANNVGGAYDPGPNYKIKLYAGGDITEHNGNIFQPNQEVIKKQHRCHRVDLIIVYATVFLLAS